MNLNKVTLVVITLTIAIAFLSFVAYYKFVYQPFQLSSGIPSTALISVNGVDIIVYDNTQTIEISELNFGTFEVGDYSESKWKKQEIWFYFTNVSTIYLQWNANESDYITTEILYEKSNNLWFKWNPNSPKIINTQWLHLSVKVKINSNIATYSPKPESFYYLYTFDRVG